MLGAGFVDTGKLRKDLEEVKQTVGRMMIAKVVSKWWKIVPPGRYDPSGKCMVMNMLTEGSGGSGPLSLRPIR